ncbi:restriction endonuclease subunit S [Mammaliicoccus lentus]|uniref:restriction endonuclease subunit S n=1 Tax=Mammaliicoccus lentus TaxID=42858 RepID=UPI003D0C4559
MEFKKYKLDEILTLNPTLKLKKNTIAKKIAMENIKEYQKKIDDYTYSEFKSGSKFMNGDTLLARITPCLENGKTAYVDILDKNEIAFGSTEFFVLRPKDNLMDSHFLYYLMRTNELRKTVIKSMTGTSGRQRAQKESILEYEFCLPSLKVQKAIAKLLKNLDDKIEINKKIIANLEELSQTLFKRWFVDFEFPDENDNPYKSSGGEMIDSELGKIPKDWKIKKLDDLLNLIIDHRGKTPKKLGSDWSEKGMPAISAKNIKNRKLVNVDKIKFINRETYVKWMKNEVEKGDIILTSEAPLGETYLINEDSKWVLSQRLYAMRTNESLNYIYFWEYVNSHYFQNELTKRSSGSTVTGIRQKELIQILVIVPPLKFQKKYFEILNPLVDDITRRNNEITMLTQLRDTLLPKLMSGEIEIPDDIEVNEDELSI